MSTEQPNIDELAGLTPEERAALAEDDAPPAAEPEQPAAEQVELRHDPAPILTAVSGSGPRHPGSLRRVRGGGWPPFRRGRNHGAGIS